MKRCLFFGFALLLSLLGCTRENPADQPSEQPSEQLDGKMVITAGFEKMTWAESGSKTFVSDGTEVHWASADADKVIYVFDSKGAKNVFTSSETAESAKRSFAGDISEDAEVAWILWSGKTAADDNSAIIEVTETAEPPVIGNEPIGSGGTIEFETKAEGGETHSVFAGSSLRVVNPQTVSHTNSFAQDANIAVMKPGDAALRSALGYIRFTVPAGEGGHASIKSVTFTADENLVGELQIDYSGNEPVARIVADGSKSLTVNTRFDSALGYEAGTLYAVLPAGTYHNLKVTVTPFSGDAATQDAATGEPYTLSSKNAVVVKRGQYTDAGELAPGSTRKPKVHLAGDSLCAYNGPNNAPQCGWGQCLSAALDGGEVINRAIGGRSTKSFIDNGDWANLLTAVEPGDLVLIMFAHNDGSSEEARHTDPQTTYKQNLTKFINETIAAGCTPVLMTSVSSRSFDGTTLKHTTATYAAAMRELASDTGTALIDINELTYQFFNNLGITGTEPYFVMDKRNPTAMDNTHLTTNGAEVVAWMIAHGLKDLGLWKFSISEETLVPGLITVTGGQAFSLGSEGGTVSVSFTSNKDWTVTTSSSWIQVNPTSGAAGEGIGLTITVPANSLGEARSTYATIHCKGNAKHIAIAQFAAEGVDVNWPTATDSFDYGLGPGESRKGRYLAEDLAKYNITGGTALPNEDCLIDGITYRGPGMYYYGNRMSTQKVNNEWSTSYPNVVPASNCFSLTINKPGSISFYQSIGSGIERVPTYYLAVVTNKNGALSAKIVDSVIPTEVTDARPSSDASADPKYFVTLTVSAADLEGITAPAKVYLYHRWTSGNTCQVHYYPLTWTSWDGNTTTPTRVPKFLLAGDSTCTEYPASAAPQNGWGQNLAAALGGDVRVDNFAIGGESTKSFIDEGKWANLVADIVSGDIVLIQFGHNDEKDDEAHHTDPSTTYKENLTKMINDTKAKGGTPVLLTSICRRYFHSNGNPQRTHGDYPQAMRDLATATNTALIDTEEETYQWLLRLGPEGSEPYYVMDKRDASAMDNTHLTVEGAQAVAAMIVQGLRELGLWAYE